MATEWMKKKVLVTVRTYPVPARKGVEVSCTAGITDDGKWIRLYSVYCDRLAYRCTGGLSPWVAIRIPSCGTSKKVQPDVCAPTL